MALVRLCFGRDHGAGVIFIRNCSDMPPVLNLLNLLVDGQILSVLGLGCCGARVLFFYSSILLLVSFQRWGPRWGQRWGWG